MKRNKKELKRLLLLVLEDFKFNTYSGLCRCIGDLYKHDDITMEEENLLLDYIWKHRPWNKLFCHRQFAPVIKNSSVIECFLWESYVKEPRIQWLNKHIKRNS